MNFNTMKTRLIIFCLLLCSGSLIAQNNVPKAVAPYSPAVMANGTLYLSGQLPLVPETKVLVKGDLTKATEQCMKNIGALLKQNGLDYEDLVMVNIYMTNMDNYKIINEAYATFFKNQKFPARAAIQIGKLPMDAEVEISGIAVKH